MMPSPLGRLGDREREDLMHTVVTGASSGIGRAIAVAFDRPEYAA